ncbi:response regulator transcription factor [Jiulongibacter sediminis]|uniref:LuxR family transcriptional regulator n=1 Tax=Jiulongibacter sediminis TaxID=1605367 RepID=A0A0P7BT93_9BACT|nr:response regulator transcription factor [Jiulongibacter sediminis]KPM47752.1 LuxR family transcriptional regulator [Jiulongibacter sediminis]TBX23935.1 LuxR family transcriptional regulator [Jiulongibacter sediminis]
MNKIKLAVVDDHNLFRAGLVQILNQSDDLEVVLEATDGREFLTKLSSTEIDVILLDVDMPDLNGIEVTEKLRKDGQQDPKIIILSMHDEDQFILHLLEIGANGYLLKDTDPDELEEAIKKVYEKGIYFTDFVSRVMLNKATIKTRQRSGKFFNYKTDLSERELEVLGLICEGFTTAEIADKVCLSPRTVDGHRTRIMEKLGVHNTASLVAFAIKNDLISI